MEVTLIWEIVDKQKNWCKSKQKVLMNAKSSDNLESLILSFFISESKFRSNG